MDNTYCNIDTISIQKICFYLINQLIFPVFLLTYYKLVENLAKDVFKNSENASKEGN